MAATKVMFIALCLSVLVCGSFSHRGRPRNISDRLIQSCPKYALKKVTEGKGTCTKGVLEKVAEWDFKSHGGRYYYMKNLFNKARIGMLCYTEGPNVEPVQGACHAMELSCRKVAPKVIDNCWKALIEAARYPVNPRVTTRPNVPNAPGGRGF